MFKFHFVILCCVTIKLFQCSGVVNIPNKFQFPFGGPFMGIFLALALPLDTPELDVFVAYNFEGTYLLPENQTEFTYPPLLDNAPDTGAISRNFIYNIFEYKLNSIGVSGKYCILRSICEAAEYSTKDTSGVLGDIIHVILTPSTSKNFDLPREYEDAEKYGKSKKHCKKYQQKCSLSLLKLITWKGLPV